MTYATDVCCTSSSGGTGNLTLTSVSSGPYAGSPQFSDVWGSSAPWPWIDYKIIEYTDYTCSTILQSETGICPLYNGNILQRTASNSNIFETYLYTTLDGGGGYSTIMPSAVNLTPPTAMNFGTHPNNIRIFSSYIPSLTYQTPRFVNTTVQDVNNLSDLSGRTCGNLTLINDKTLTYTNGNLIYFPYLFTSYKQISKFSIYVINAGGASTVARMGIYEDNGSGYPGNLIIDTATATGGATWSTGSTGLKTVTITNPILVKPGFVWGCYQANGTTGLIQCVHTPQINPGGTSSTYNIRCATKSGTYGNLPNPAPVPSGFSWQISSLLTPMVLLE